MTSAQPDSAPEQLAKRLAVELGRHRRWFVITGAGCSTASGIPAYRDANGAWQHKAPIQLREFLGSAAIRRRYWARSFVGFQRIARAEPNAAHVALARLEALGRSSVLVTQNVDGLHQKAGSRNVIDLHGQLAHVQCLSCCARHARSELQERLSALNPWLPHVMSRAAAPDGDAELDDAACQALRVPECAHCGGVLKPAVVFFGETVPAERISAAYRALQEADAVLVVGSSLMVFSGYRFVRRAAAASKPVYVVNDGLTRADGLCQEKFCAACGPLLAAALEHL